MFDFPGAGLVLCVERNTLDSSTYKLLADFVAENELNLQLEIGNFIISKHALPASMP